MSLSLSKSNNTNFIVSPQNLTEAMNFAKMISDSSLCPPGFKGKSGDVIIAMQMGAELGLSPLQALQNISVINGRACVWGDAQLAIVQSSSNYVDHREWFEGTVKEGNLTAFCAVTRRGQEEYVKTFSQEDAEKAGLWKKAGVWQNYPSRMLQMRARSFALRDKFADALRGIESAEEVSDYQVVDIKSERAKSYPVKQINVVKAVEEVNHDNDELEIHFVEFKEGIIQCETEEALKDLFTYIINNKDKFKSRPDLLKQLVELKDEKKLELSRAMVDDYLGSEEVNTETGEIKSA